MNIKSALGDFKDEFVEQVVKGIPKTAKKQIFDNKVVVPPPDEKNQKKVDPVTNKPVPSKKTITQLSQATVQLQQIRLKKVREELEKIRLKVTDEKELANKSGEGPAMPTEKPKVPQDNAVQATLRNAQSTGEAGKNIGG